MRGEGDAATRCEAIAIGGSAGALGLVLTLLGALPADYPIPLLLCLHLHPDEGGALARHLGERTALTVVDARDKTPIEPGRVYVAPANYHLLVERARTLALSIDEKVHFCRPSIDLLFTSAARAYTTGLLAILLSGANEDGAAGLGSVQAYGGLTVAQDPTTAEFAAMPCSAIDAHTARWVLAPDDLRRLVLRQPAHAGRGPPDTCAMLPP